MDLAIQLLTSIGSESTCILFYDLQYRLTAYIVPRISQAFSTILWSPVSLLWRTLLSFWYLHISLYEERKRERGKHRVSSVDVARACPLRTCSASADLLLLSISVLVRGTHAFCHTRELRQSGPRSLCSVQELPLKLQFLMCLPRAHRARPPEKKQ